VLAAAAGGAALFLILRERKFAMQPA